MKNKIICCISLLVLYIGLYSCRDFIEVELSGKSVVILAPTNNTQSPSYSQLFKWEELEGAESYQLQIVKPSFATIQQFVVDTNTTATQFSYTLQPGSYQWRIRGMNNSSHSEYVTYNLIIDSTLDLSSSVVLLISPNDNLNSNVMTRIFSWDDMPFADNYILQISGPVSTLESTTATSASHAFTLEGTYLWKVYAQNSYSNSGYTTRTIIIDATAPAMPVPVFPLLDTITANPIPLQWNTSFGADSSHILISTANDSLFSSAPLKDTTILKTGTSMTYNFYSAAIGAKYFWKVQDVDLAGNKSAYFARRRIIRN
ncbi:MAG: hypothetical protein H0X46_04815 [Bacteroidetes bacterium]|nr:hypothetical protein [Bacteroidota bacterium]